LLKDYNLHIQYHPEKVNVVVDAATRKTQHTLNVVAIIQLNLSRRPENLNIRLVSDGQASKNINGSNSFEFETIVLCNRG